MKLYWVLFPLLLSIGCCKRPHGFTLKKITSQYENDSRWDVPSLSSEEATRLSSLLNQSFTYLGSGNVCYAFGSEDGHYVLKLFKQKNMQTKTGLSHIPLVGKAFSSKTRKYERRKKQREKKFVSYKIAYLCLKEETGIFYLHLNKSRDLKKEVNLIDLQGQKYKINIDDMEFLIQKRAKVGYQRLTELFSEGRKQEALEGISSLLNLISMRMEKGIYDSDLQIFKNFGFIGNQAVELDIGEFKIDPAMQKVKRIQDEVAIIANQIKDWAKTHYPEHLDDIHQMIDETINQIKN